MFVSEEIEWPEDEWAPPDDAQDLILKLLIHNPLDRLGVGGAQQVRAYGDTSPVRV